ncbi:actin-histidine N-methyltransferase-like [Lytechinus pictus]|uniref:actin-histidine N-methyltransferase-like n=1 Tax=Lytechinus pictus TaxID=7653 RepID=UPI0030B9B90B
MGRKSKRKTNPGPDEVSKADRKELIKLCGQVIDLAATPIPPTTGEQWEEFLQIHNVIEKIRKRQNGEPNHQSKREEHFEAFFKWLNENGVSSDSVKIAKFDQGYGLQATKDIKSDEQLLNIPRKVMITDQNALESHTIDFPTSLRYADGSADLPTDNILFCPFFSFLLFFFLSSFSLHFSEGSADLPTVLQIC